MLRHASFRLLIIISVITGIFSMSFKSRVTKNKAVSTVVHMYLDDMQRLDSLLAIYPGYFLDSSYEVRRSKYHQLTAAYKKVECFLTYFHPRMSYETFLAPPQFQKRDFGLPVPDNWIILGPFGIDPDSVLKKRNQEDSVFEKMFIQRAVINIRKSIAACAYRQMAEQMTESQLFDALRLQIARISTMNLANADIIIEEAAMTGFQSSFESWTSITAVLAQQLPASAGAMKASFENLADQGKTILRSNPGFRSFDRMHFLTEVLIPLSSLLRDMQKAMGVDFIERPSAYRTDAKHIFDKDAFNTDYFAPGAEAYLTEARVELGKFLFFDPILSDNNERACASCHKPELAFTDGNKKSLNFERGDLPRNAPTVINAVFQKNQFWDLRATSLEDQLDSVINSPDELHSNFENVIDRIKSSKEYRKLFQAAFPEIKQQGIQRQHVKIAIACYERRLTGLNSRFDQYVRGNKSMMTAAEVNGFNLYMGKAKCGTCHFAPFFNGAIPPYFDITDHKSLGIPVKDTMELYELDPDVGASRPLNNPLFHVSFKTPTVRNAELTAPYMHNGVYNTLEQVIEFYDHAGGNKFTSHMRKSMKGIPFFMILPEQLKLTPEEKTNLIAFIRALTDNSAATNIPSRLPVIEGRHAALNKRKIGGVY